MLAARYLSALVLPFILSATLIADDRLSPGDWPQFRGWQAAGIADGRYPPVSWDAQAWTNVRWKMSIPGLGHASPIVVGERVFIVTAISGEPEPKLRVGLYGDIAPVDDRSVHSWHLYSFDKRTGKLLWDRTLAEGVPKIKRHTKATHANSTPASDGNHVVVFLASEGLHCYDVCGNLLWKKDLGVLDSGFYFLPAAQWGFGSSPIIYRGQVIVQCDVQKNSFLAAFDVRDGRELWRTARDDVPTWSTPTICAGATRTELVVNGCKHAGGYDPMTGQELWRLGGGGDIPVPTPVVAGDLVFFSSAHGFQAPLCAVRAGASGDITPKAGATADPHIAWHKRAEGIYMQTPIVYGDQLYACRDNGVVSCYDAGSGELLYRERLGGGRSGFTASPVAADGKLYFTSEEGDIFVVQAGPRFQLLATNPMGEVCMATPAISDGMLLVRTKDHLVAISEKERGDVILAGFSDDPGPESQTHRCGCGRGVFGWFRRLHCPQ